MRILILGGDGYLGWATAMHFSKRGHEVHAIDTNERRVEVLAIAEGRATRVRVTYIQHAHATIAANLAALRAVAHGLARAAPVGEAGG